MNDIDRLAEAFCRQLRVDLTPVEIAEADRRNDREMDEGVCHTHDFCDANMTMHRAWVEVFGREPLLPCDSETEMELAELERQVAVWSAAWDAAKKKGLRI